MLEKVWEQRDFLMSKRPEDMVLDSLPPRPLPTSVVESLTESERIQQATPFMSHGGADGEELVFQFVIGTGERFYAMALNADGDGWEVIGKGDEFMDAADAISEFNEENELDVWNM